MLTYVFRRLLAAIPVLLFISLVIFLLLDLAPGDPTAQLPLTIPPDVRENIRKSFGIGEPVYIRYILWLKHVAWSEPLHYLSVWTGLFDAPQGARLISWQTRAPVMDLIWERLPQTLRVVGLAYVIGIIIALPIGIISAYRQYSVIDQIGTFVSMIGYSLPPFFSGVLAIVIFSVIMPRDSFFWFPSVYDTTLKVTDWDSLWIQLRQMVLPIMVLSLQTTAQTSRFLRAAMLDNLSQDYVRTARAKGMTETVVVLKHVLRNSVIPLVTVIALGVPGIFGGRLLRSRYLRSTGSANC